MKNIYDQTGLAPVSVSIRGDLPRLILNIPRLPGIIILEQSGGCHRPLFWRVCTAFDRELSCRRLLL